MSDANKTLLENTMVEISQKAKPDQAKRIAKVLSNAKSDRVSELLPKLYPDRLRGGLYHYGVAAVEAGECKGKKQAVIHYTTATDPAKRLAMLEDIKSPIRSSKPRLKKCDTGEWTVSVSPEPLEKGQSATALAEKLKSDLETKGFKVKLQKEKQIKLN